MATFGTIEPFDMKPGNWLTYEDRIELFLEANSVDDDKKVSTFLSLVGPECYTLVKTLCSPEKPSDKTVAELFGIIREHFCPKKIVIAERYRFHNAMQTKAESITAYVTKLKKLSENCQFGDFLSEMLRDRFVCGLKDQATLQRMLTEEDLTFQSAVSISSTMEAVAKDSKELHQPNRQQSKEDGPPQKSQFPKGGGPPQQGQFPKGGGSPRRGQFPQGGGPYLQMGSGAPMGGGPYPLGQIPKSDGPYPLGQIPKSDGPYPLCQIPMDSGPYPLGQIPMGSGPYPLGQFPKGGGPPHQGQFQKGGGPPHQGQFQKGGGPPHQGQFPKSGGSPHHGQFPKGGGPPHQGQFPKGRGPQQQQGSTQKACQHCAGYKHAADTCYHKNANCTNCGKHGHIEKACRSKGKGDNSQGSPSHQKTGQGKKGGPAQPAKLPYGVQESGQQGRRLSAQSR